MVDDRQNASKQEGNERSQIESGESIVPEQYEILSELGRGGMGVVYKARNRYTDRLVAIKLINVDESSPNDLRRFMQEGRASSKVNHSNAITALDCGVFNNSPYLVMDYVAGSNLGDLVTQRGCLVESVVIEVGSQICQVLCAAHARGVIHRDLKPSNIIIQRGSDGAFTAKVLDFGLAKMINVEASQLLTRSGDVVGTPLYMSPEQFMGLPADARSDIYSLGALLYYCCTGNPPHRGETAYSTMYKRLNERPKPFPQIGKSCSEDLEMLVFKCLEVEPANRYQSANALLSDLDKLASGQPLKLDQHVGKSPLGSGRAFVQSRLAAIGAAAAIFCLAGAAFLIHAQKNVQHAMPKAQQNEHSSARVPPPRVMNADDRLAQWIRQNPDASTIVLNDGRNLDVKQMSSLKHLQTLIVDSPYIHDLSFISQLPSLQTLCINHVPEGIKPAVWNIIAQLPNLQALEIDGGTINEPDLAQLSKSSSLNRLIISHVNLTRGCCEQISKCKHLTLVGISHCSLDGTVLHPLSRLSLEFLDLGNNPLVTDAVVNDIVPRMPSLKALWLRDTGISNKSLTAISKLIQLRSLIIGGNNVSDRSVVKLASLKELRQLDLLQLRITDVSIEALARLRHIKGLYLQGADISDAAVQYLEGMKELEVLDVINTRIGKEGMKRLAAIPSLRQLYTWPGHTPTVSAANKSLQIDDSGNGIAQILPIVD
jgi:serine/threonine protein kinase